MIATLIDRAELRRWALSAAVVLGLHAAGIAALAMRPDPILAGETTDMVVVDLAPLANAAIDTPADVAPGPQQQEMDQTAPEPEKVERKPEEKIQVPDVPVPAVAALPPPEPVKPEQLTRTPPAPASTAPARQRTASQADIVSWQSRIVAQIEHHKAYPPAAHARGEKGVVRLAFSIDREGHVMSSQVLRSSGYAALDQETLATVRRAQPFPPPPADLAGTKFDFTVPVSFNIR